MRAARVLYPLIAIAYVLHFYLFDQPMNLQPEEHWRYFRMSMAGLAVSTFLIYLAPAFTHSRSYKVPAMITGAIICYFQARVSVWYEGSVYFYAFGFVIVASIALRLGIAQSLMYATAMFALQWPSFIEARLEPPLLLSAAVISLIFIVLARSTYGAEIRYFKAAQENVDNQRQIIELNIEFTDRLRAFLPREISRRLFGYVETQRMTILQAIEEVLRPRHKDIACLFSDIRGFTKSTQTGSNFVDDGVIPNVRKCTQVVEDHGGVPRKVGDLIFAYFDNSDFETNIRRCIAAAVDLVNANIAFNDANSRDNHIRRNVLVASGPAVVGNLGGFDSSIEITALGNPVNLLSRLDELVKHPLIRNHIGVEDIVVDDRTASVLRELDNARFALRPLRLTEIGVLIRDFETIPTVWVLSASQSLRHHVDYVNQEVVGANIEYVHDARKKVSTQRT
ncbi:MAG: adenylate/guanylate cyclase domain-containing protein [Gammaproteobacteria bacterium]|nr:adenylate/guanylate cyclase domain-containing protein [Gammaproteobacteria bacterium]